MKKLYSILLIALTCVKVSSQITNLNSGTTQDLNSIFFADSNIGYACGNNGVIIKTTNGGSNWATLNSGTNINLYSIYFTDSNNGYAVGGADLQTGILLKTTNGGISWALTTICNTIVTDVYFTTATTGYIIGGFLCGSGLYKTTDAGITWNSISNPNSSIWNHKMFFIDENNGFIVGSYEKFIKTNNAGIIWNGTINMSSTNHLRGVWFTNASIGYTVGDGKIIKKTTDGGNSWINLTNVLSFMPTKIRFVSSSIGYVVGESNLLKTTDAGITWIDQSINAPYGLSNIFFLDATKGFACGGNGTILKINDTTTSNNELNDYVYEIYPNPVKDQFQIKGLNEDAIVRLTDLNGHILIIKSVLNKEPISLENLPKGFYIIEIITHDSNTKRRIIKE